MNQNENEQFKKFETFIAQANKNVDDIFFDAQKVERIKIKGYDAVVYFKNEKKIYVQLTTVSNLVIKIKDNIQHANRYDLKLKPNFNEKTINKKIEFLKDSGVDRKVIKNKNKDLFVVDKTSSIFDNEKNLDEKYGINSENLLNAIYRSLMKKKNHYYIEDKKNKSYLVLIDESSNVFHKKPIVNFRDFNEKQINELKEFNIQKYFNFILKAGIVETNFLTHYFFDEVQIYFRQTHSSDSEEQYWISNTKLIDKIDLKNNLGMSQIIPISMNKVYRKTVIIITKDIDKIKKD